jgi:uncharacterized protein YpmS
MSFAHYWHWLFFALSLLIFFIVLLIFIYINWIQTYQQHNKLYKGNPNFGRKGKMSKGRNVEREKVEIKIDKSRM